MYSINSTPSSLAGSKQNTCHNTHTHTHTHTHSAYHATAMAQSRGEPYQVEDIPSNLSEAPREGWLQKLENNKPNIINIMYTYYVHSTTYLPQGFGPAIVILLRLQIIDELQNINHKIIQQNLSISYTFSLPKYVPSCVHLHPRNMDTSLNRTLSSGPLVSKLERFHCST